MHYKLIIQKVISANIIDGHATLYIPRSKAPECFNSFRTTQDLVSVALQLPLHSKAIGFIFSLFLFTKDYHH